jgi:D-hydroxyproline dehydrogenase subunit alpha
MTSSSEEFGVAVVGAGPAGLAAACAACDAGLRVAVLDINERIGGQYYRHAEGQTASSEPSPYHHGWGQFTELQRSFQRHLEGGRVVHLARHSVWSIDRHTDAGGRPRLIVRAVEGERERQPRAVEARAVIIATGAYDRQLPFPGWTLPGVMAGGGAQALLKGSLVAPGKRAVVAGTGPFLLAVSDGLLAAGVDVAEVVEANAPWAMARYPRALPGLFTKLGEALGYGRRLRRSRVPYRTRQAVIAAHGDQHLQAVTIARVDADWNVVGGSERRVDCDLLTVGYGFTPQVELALAVGCEHGLGHDGSVVIRAGRDGRTSVPGVYAAGETTGIGGAELAVIEGRLCGAAAASDLGACAHSGDKLTTERLRFRRRLLRQFAAALHRAHPVRSGWQRWLADDTVICRCEEVPYGRVREALEELGAQDARAVKLIARPGMGWCQGRICGCAVAALAAHHCGREPASEDLVAMSKRTIGNPVPLGHLVSLDPGSDAGRSDGHTDL